MIHYSQESNLALCLGFKDMDDKSSLSSFISTYHLIETLPKELQSFLPSAEEIAARLSLFDEKEK